MMKRFWSVMMALTLVGVLAVGCGTPEGTEGMGNDAEQTDGGTDGN